MDCVFAFAVTACACYGQSVSVGVAGGVRLTDDISGNVPSESKRYVVGPEVELGLPFGLAVEVDALYRREGYSSFSGFIGDEWERERANSWEFPILLKYKLRFPVVKPFVEAGYAPRVIDGAIDTSFGECHEPGECVSPQQIHSGADWNSTHGVIFGGGVQVAFGRLRISPEVRYTRWSNAVVNSPGNSPIQSARNQVDAVLGIGWKVH